LYEFEVFRQKKFDFYFDILNKKGGLCNAKRSKEQEEEWKKLLQESIEENERKRIGKRNIGERYKGLIL